jgi:hypothetical protein
VLPACSPSFEACVCVCVKSPRSFDTDTARLKPDARVLCVTVIHLPPSRLPTTNKHTATLQSCSPSHGTPNPHKRCCAFDDSDDESSATAGRDSCGEGCVDDGPNPHANETMKQVRQCSRNQAWLRCPVSGHSRASVCVCQRRPVSARHRPGRATAIHDQGCACFTQMARQAAGRGVNCEL